MGWLPWSSAGAAAPAEPAGPPKREDRVRCWDSRDVFFACLDKHNIIDSIKEDEKMRQVCASEHQKFEKNCVASWVNYFKNRRVSEYEKEQLLKRHEEDYLKKS